MKIRRFMLLITAVCAVMLGCSDGGTSDTDTDANNSTENEEIQMREVLNMNTGWLYSPADYENGAIVDLNESDFEAVSVPHANTLLSSHGGDGFQSQIESYRFVSWYRCHFTLGEAYAGKSIYINFEGVATTADVYVNGEHVGTHKGAYTGFTFDITDFVKTDGSDNVVAVRVDSTKQNIPPEGGNVDYCLFGGIVRDVNMIVTEKVRIGNYFITTPDIAEGDSRVHVSAELANNSDTAKEATIEITVRDTDGKAVASGSVAAELPARAVKSVELDTDKIENVILWDTENPYLYSTEIRIYVDGTCADNVSEKTGFRWFYFTDTKDESAFYLNGKEMTIVGVNRHEQWPWIGRAANNKLQAADAELIKDTGFNAVRCSHYPQDTSFLDRCDELGLLVFEEAPGWQYIGDKEWQELYIQNIEEMILRDRNHPSIISWGVRVNESDDSHALYEKTNALSKSLDPTRPTHASRRMETYDVTECQEDIFSINYIYPEKPKFTPFVITEHSNDWYNGNGFPSAKTSSVLKFIDSFGSVLDYFYENKFCSGGFAWSMFDYNNEVNYTNTGNVFYSGLYDIFRYEKPVAYLYRSQKDPSDEVVLYIANYWADDSDGNILVLSNCDEVELFVNGKSVNRIKPNTYKNIPYPAFTFRRVEYEAGELTAVGYIDGKEVATFTRKTPEKAASLILTPDYASIVADGSDFTSVSVELVDKNGTRLYYAADEVTFTLEGNGKFIGEQTIALEGGHTAFLVQSEYMKTGKVKCTATLKGGKIIGKCEITVTEYVEENSVPMGSGNGKTAPVELVEHKINDTVTSGNKNYFEYVGSWLYCYEAGCYKKDNHYSLSAGDTYTLHFTGTGAKLYAGFAPAHGICAVSVDGGEEVLVDCYSPTRNDNRLLFEVSGLEYGEHTVTVRVTGEKNAAANGYYITADRAVIE